MVFGRLQAYSSLLLDCIDLHVGTRWVSGNASGARVQPSFWSKTPSYDNKVATVLSELIESVCKGAGEGPKATVLSFRVPTRIAWAVLPKPPAASWTGMLFITTVHKHRLFANAQACRASGTGVGAAHGPGRLWPPRQGCLRLFLSRPPLRRRLRHTLSSRDIHVHVRTRRPL